MLSDLPIAAISARGGVSLMWLAVSLVILVQYSVPRVIVCSSARQEETSDGP